MEKIEFKGHYIGLDVRTGSLAIVPTEIKLVASVPIVDGSPEQGRVIRRHRLQYAEAARAVHKLLGEGKVRKYLRITIEEVGT